ncbi:sucrose nonfermenting 4-like protein [Medicago truncatula]|uniref:sucrose nonfermenting 4-like protein n=1 Tax=Medicago truncatula TaxID=3880 RepID=UPI00014FDD59|nr:sucrose nonfermenting 4-like protein [Medicago truncatula]
MSGSLAAGRGGNGSSSDVPVPDPQPFSIPHLFVWPHGGESAFLCGSFTGWSTNLPMSRIEGRPTGFQVVCYLTPELHTYQFCVDGVWRHDEQQPFINGFTDTVNTISVAEPYMLHGMPSRSHMHLINVNRHMGAFPRTPEFALLVSRYHIYKYMSINTANDLLPESGKVIVLNMDLSLKQAFHILYEQEVSLTPVWDSRKCKFVGVLSGMDIIQALKEPESHRSTLTDEGPETHTLAACIERKLQQCGTDSNGKTYPWSFVDARPSERLEDIVLKFLQYKVAVVAIMHSSSEGGSTPQLLHMTSPSEIIKCICKHFKNDYGSLPVLQLPIGSIPLGTWAPKVGESNKQPIATLRPNASLSAAISLMNQAEVSSIPIVDDSGSLYDVYSRSDLTALARCEMYARISLDSFNISEALNLRKNGKCPYGLILPTCLRSDPLHVVMECLANSGVGEVVVVKSACRSVEGIISIGDVFKLLLG